MLTQGLKYFNSIYLVDLGLLLFIFAFTLVAISTLSRKRKAEFQIAENLPLNDGGVKDERQ